MKYNFDELIDRRRTDSLKWRVYGEDVLPMWIADMDFRSPEPVIQALKERVAHGVFGYPDNIHPTPAGGLGLRQALVERMWERYGWTIQPEDVVLIPGVITGFNLACHALAVPEGAVLIQPPVYRPILLAPENAGQARQDAQLQQGPGGAYEIDWEEFEGGIDDRTQLFLLCNPHNPVGRVFRREELEQMAAICLRRGVRICSDEIHSDLAFSGHRHIPIASIDPEVAQNTITLVAPSKTFNLAGLASSAAIIQNPELRKRYQRAGKGLAGWVNLMGMVAAEAAYRDGQEWLDQLLVYLEGNRDFLYEFVQSELPGIRMQKPEATFLAWLDCRQGGIDGDPYRFFLEKARVALSSGTEFGTGGEDFVRLNFGCPRPVLEEALGRMKRAMVEA